MNDRFGIVLTILLVAAASILKGQQTVHVVTKRIEKTFNYKAGYELNIEGEKAQVEMDSWAKNEIRVVMELVARHPEKATAEEDLEAMKYLADRIRNKIYLRNYVSVKEGDPKPAAELSATYHITLPENCPVYLKNFFGVSNISNLSGGLRLQSEFSRVGLQNISGEMNLRTRFGDLFAEQLDGDVSLYSRRSDVTLRDIQGVYRIQAAYGTLNLFINPGLAELDIRGEKTDIFLHGPDLDQFRYDLTALEGDILFPRNVPLQYVETTAASKQMSFTPDREYYANVTIRITLGSINLKNKP